MIQTVDTILLDKIQDLIKDWLFDKKDYEDLSFKIYELIQREYINRVISQTHA